MKGSESLLEPQATLLKPEADMGVTWSRDIDRSLAEAKEQNRPILLDFSAAPS